MKRLLLALATVMTLPVRAQSTLGLEPGDHRLQNDDLGVVLWGPDTAPTLSVGKSDLWDRRLPKDQPVITMKEIMERAMAGDKAVLNGASWYTAYNHYDFPCPKPGGQLILQLPFVEGGGSLKVDKANGGTTLTAEHGSKRLQVRLFVSAVRNIIVLRGEASGLEPGDVAFQLWRHQDTIVPGGELHPTIAGRASPTDFEPLPPPKAGGVDQRVWVEQSFPAEQTFPEGFRAVLACQLEGASAEVKFEEGVVGGGTPMVAPQEGRLDHGTFKRFTPINEAPGAVATLSPSNLDGPFNLYATIATTQDGADVLGHATRTLEEALKTGAEALWAEHAQKLAEFEERPRARAWSADGRLSIDQAWGGVPYAVRPAGYYGDVALCSVDSTKFCIQDSSRWHADFHFNEIDATGPCTLRQFDALQPYYDMIHTMLPMAQANAREVYGCDGAMYPLVHYPLKADTVIHTHMTWEQSVEITALLARPFWLRWRFTADRDFLRDRAWPILREGARFYADYLKLEDDGYYHVFPTVSPEHRGITDKLEFNKDSQSALTLIRFHLRAAVNAAQLLGLENEESARWRELSEKLPPYPVIDTPDGPIFADVAGAPPMEFNIAVPLTSVFWGDDIGLDSPPEQVELAKRTLEKINVWQPHQGYLSTVRRRLGIYRPEDGLAVENLLQSHTGVLRVFPTVPEDFEGGFENLGAQGAFVVSATRGRDEVQEVRVHSLSGNVCVMAAPWPERAATLTDLTSEKRVVALHADERGRIQFETTANGVYRLNAAS